MAMTHNYITDGLVNILVICISKAFIKISAFKEIISS